MIEKEIIFANQAGLHARRALYLVETASSYSAEITLRVENRGANGKSVLEVLRLSAGRGSRIKIRVSGGDEEEAIRAITAILEKAAD